MSSVSPDRRTVHLVNALNFTHHGVTEVLEDGQFIELRSNDITLTVQTITVIVISPL